MVAPPCLQASLELRPFRFISVRAHDSYFPNQAKRASRWRGKGALAACSRRYLRRALINAPARSRCSP
eukprot:scaffold23077_cov68-Phaeocystis_antarctica.AAC.8